MDFFALRFDMKQHSRDDYAFIRVVNGRMSYTRDADKALTFNSPRGADVWKRRHLARYGFDPVDAWPHELEID